MADKIELILYLVDRVSSIEPINTSLVNLVSKLCASFVQNETRREEENVKERKKRKKKTQKIDTCTDYSRQERNIVRSFVTKHDVFDIPGIWQASKII